MIQVVGILALFALLAIGIVDLARDRDDAAGRRIGRPRLLVLGLVIFAVGLSPIGFGYEIVNPEVTYGFVMACAAIYLVLYFAALRTPPSSGSAKANRPDD